MNILVTGGAGFIGSNFVRYMLRKHPDSQISVSDKLTYAGNLNNLKDVMEGIKFVKGDICNKATVEKEMKDTDIVFNFAAETHVDRSIASAEDFMKSNVLGTYTLLEIARKYDIEKFIQISTDEVYGDIVDGSFSEGDSLRPSSPYAASKAAADMFVLAYYRTYGLHAVITRSTNNFGPYQFPEKFLPKTIIRAFLSLQIPIYGSGKNIRDWIYVMDHCEALDILLKKGKPGEIYNISGGNECENVEVVKKILELIGKDESLIEFVEDRPGHDVRYSLDSSKIRNEMSWSPRYDFKDALKQMVRWYLENEWWWRPIATGEVLHPTPWKFH